MIFIMPRIDTEVIDDAMKRVDVEIGAEPERVNFRAVIQAMYDQKTQTPTISDVALQAIEEEVSAAIAALSPAEPVTPITPIIPKGGE